MDKETNIHVEAHTKNVSQDTRTMASMMAMDMVNVNEIIRNADARGFWQKNFPKVKEMKGHSFFFSIIYLSLTGLSILLDMDIEYSIIYSYSLSSFFFIYIHYL